MPRDAPMQAPWRARLALAFERRDARTLLASRVHDGPLVVQKSLHPEGDAICHAIVVHPPGGIAGGDELTLEVRAEEGAHALLTTPAAAKWYRSSGAWARQRVQVDVEEGGALEWLPQETIVFDGARADWHWEARLARGARLIAWDIACLGRGGSGERFSRGVVRFEQRIVRAGRVAWIERGSIEPESPTLRSPVGLNGCTVIGTFLVAGIAVPDEALATARAAAPLEGEGAVTRIGDLLVARYRGDSTEAARRYFTSLWTSLRPVALGREAIEPRIWRT